MNYTILSPVENKDYDFLAVMSNAIENKDWNDLYDQYGQNNGFGEETCQYVDSIEYHDGSNFRSAPIANGDYPHPAFKTVDEDMAQKILSELEDAEWVYERGISTANTVSFTFHKSQFAGIDGIFVNINQ